VDWYPGGSFHFIILSSLHIQQVALGHTAIFSAHLPCLRLGCVNGEKSQIV
jgi:hypothetical protein